jgi:uncharacterized membrane protein
MSELIVGGYADARLADEARTDLFGVESAYLPQIGEAVIATVDRNGAIQLNQMLNLWTASPSGTGFRTLLSSLLFLLPLAGILEKSTSCRLVSSLEEFGINGEIVRELGRLLEPGRAAVILLSPDEPSDFIAGQLLNRGASILRVPVSAIAETRLRSWLAIAHELAWRHRAEINGTVLG